jgi:hypothetical protein
MARKQHTYHYIYKIICKVTNKFYVGMHSCSNLEDGYMGSGKRLGYSIRKYGLENHTKEILEFLNDRESLAKREAEIVNEQFLQDPLCMNLQIGGGGGFHSIKQQQHRSRCGGKATAKKLLIDTNYREKHAKIASDNFKEAHKNGKIKYNTFLDKQHSEVTKQLMREKAQQRVGDKNSQYGTCWITNELENKKICKGEIIPDGWHLGRKIG